jgi:hypothetical protein
LGLALGAGLVILCATKEGCDAEEVFGSIVG